MSVCSPAIVACSLWFYLPDGSHNRGTASVLQARLVVSVQGSRWGHRVSSDQGAVMLPRLLFTTPLHLQLAIRRYAVLQVEVNEGLIRYAHILRHVLEVVNDVGSDTQRDLLLQSFGIGIGPGLHLRQIVTVIVEDGDRFLEGNAMLFPVQCGLLWIPLETQN